MSPRRPDPAVSLRLVEAAARVLADEGEGAVSARRIAGEAGVSTMAVYTHFGSMDDLLAAVRREGFQRFGIELDRPALTADPVADLMAQGWGYRHFALTDRHLYRVLFQPRASTSAPPTEGDIEASMATFGSLLRRIERCVAADRFTIDDVVTTGEVVWSVVHGHSMIELAGHHETMGRDPVASYEACMLHLVIGFGDEPDAARRSLVRSRARAQRIGQLA